MLRSGVYRSRFSTSDDNFLDLLRQRYHGFLSSSCPEFELVFDLVGADSVSDDDVRVSRDGEMWRIERGDFRAQWDPRTGKGVVRQNSNPYSLDSVLRIVHSLILAQRGGFLLHAASAICEGHAYLFSGVSGAGKTTMTRLAPPDVTLLNGRNFVSSAQAPSGDGYAAFGTPFAGELAQAWRELLRLRSPRFFLSGSRVRKIALMNSRLRKLSDASCAILLFFAEDRSLGGETLLETACDFVARVPIRRLTFYPDARECGMKVSQLPWGARACLKIALTLRAVRTIAARALAGETTVMNSADSTFFTLNEVATAIFQAADGRSSAAGIVRDRICQQFDIDPEQAQADAEQFVADLSSHGILLVSDQPLASRELSQRALLTEVGQRGV